VPPSDTPGPGNAPRAAARRRRDILAEARSPKVSPDWYPYGIEQNRPSIEALLQYAHEHGLTARRVKLEELFAPSTLRDIPLTEGQQI
jgi:4,5-dihydroxyphthalate decarboxylase